MDGCENYFNRDCELWSLALIMVSLRLWMSGWHIVNGVLKIFSERGALLSESCFLEGKRQGVFRLFYLNGCLYAVLNYQNGLKEGRQESFYKDGSFKTVEHYSLGKLDGEVLLYWPNGVLKRRSYFLAGVCRQDQFWSEDGISLS